MNTRRLLVAVVSAVLLVLTQVGSTASAGSSAEVASAKVASAKKRTYFQNVVVPGYSVYCRYVPKLLIVDGRRGEGCFDSNKNRFAVVDTKKDGRGVAVLWVLLDSNKRGICRNGTGSKKRPAWPTCTFASTIPEKRKIRAWVSSCDVTKERNCRKWGHYPRQKKALKRVYRTSHPADG